MDYSLILTRKIGRTWDLDGITEPGNQPALWPLHVWTVCFVKNYIYFLSQLTKNALLLVIEDIVTDTELHYYRNYSEVDFNHLF